MLKVKPSHSTWDKSGWYSLHTGNGWLIDCFLWATDKITRICRHFTPKIACVLNEYMCARAPPDVVWMKVCVHKHLWTWSEWMYVCTSTSGCGLTTRRVPHWTPQAVHQRWKPLSKGLLGKNAEYVPLALTERVLLKFKDRLYNSYHF